MFALLFRLPLFDLLPDFSHFHLAGAHGVDLLAFLALTGQQSIGEALTIIVVLNISKLLVESVCERGPPYIA